MTYRPTFRKQLDGSRCQGTNCGCASASMAAQRHREGADPRNHHGWPPKPPEVRNQIIAMYGGGCSGTTLNEQDGAVTHLYLANLDVRYNIPWTSFKSLIISGRGAIVPMHYGTISPTRFDACPGFTGNHAIYVNERRSTDGAFLVYDPLADHRRSGIPQGPQWWPASLLQKSMYAYPGTDTGRVHAAFTKDTE